MSEHINPITGRAARQFRERKAARIAAGEQTFVFRVTASGGYVALPETELPQKFKSRREALNFAYEQLSSRSGHVRAEAALSAMGHITLNVQYEVWRINETTGERSRVSHMEYWK